MAGNTSTPLNLLAIEASEFNGELINQTFTNVANVANYKVTVNYSDSFKEAIYLTISLKDNSTVSIKETTSKTLPSCCPQRHINYDGTFCLGLNDIRIIDSLSAIEWWKTVIKFLQIQKRVSKKRSWIGSEWAHGDAAKYQHEAESLVVQLGSDFIKFLKEKKFKVIKKIIPNRGSALRLYANTTLVYAVWEIESRVANTRQRCVCMQRPRRRMRSCKNHASICAQLVISIWNMQLAEEKFWELFKDQKCCGTIDYCPLANR
jgi:hypothetical protein